MLTVHLHNLHFYAFHGLYEGEETAGNNFEVNLDVTYHVRKGEMDDLKNLINYEDIYKIVQQRMSFATPLLEELASGILYKIKHEYAQVSAISISIFKLQAPIENFQGKVGITFFKNFEV
ncbi:dihydroneopterin aldolase [Flavihumibacter profundi]|jgi:7,8-dihydroneopterin aldolase/epimerase/oxygenase|uniref:dihydroneopterin aldolase n=1 Tax=Flavihumibacter profundi TaxID=2716883 RepID=UPI001CC4CE4E|nr:dihydroneopterin aldolase [Flavihumibacter profundi]MBZ5855951.1 dihydroneopterin aldolase [Flavihumibacter profundi]